MCTIKAELKAQAQDACGYITYVFENLNPETWRNQFISTVRFPNWDAPFPKIGEIGFLTYKEVTAGEDKWWDKNTQQRVSYNYDNIVFIDFIREQNDKPIVLL